MIKNLRDVGETINLLAGQEIMVEGVLFRGGSVNGLFDKTELPPITTILNLRSGEDKSFADINNIHIPAVDSVENYHTHLPLVKNWANRALQAIDSPSTYPPVNPLHGRQRSNWRDRCFDPQVY